MRQETKSRCEQLIRNRDLIKTVFSWDNGLLHLCCAGIYTQRGADVDAQRLKKCKELLNSKVGTFSNFKGVARSPIVSILAASGNETVLLEKALTVYQLLKKEFWSSAYLPVVAVVIAELTSPSEYERIASRTKRLYSRMKKAHPFLTSGEDSTFCAIMAMSEKSDDMLIDEMEQCYGILKGKFFSSNAVQSLSHVLTLYEGDAREKCEACISVFDRFYELGYKYGTSYELPTLGVLAMCGQDREAMVQEIIEVDQWLSQQRGFGFFSSVSKKERLMYAGSLVQTETISSQKMQVAAVEGVLSALIAQEAAMCAAIAACSAASASSSST